MEVQWCDGSAVSGRKCNGNVELAVLSRKWFGVRASRSVASGLTGVIGLSLGHCSTNVGPNNRWDDTTGAKSFYSHHTATGVQATNYSKVNSASRETCEKETPAFFSGPPNFHKEVSEIVYTSV